MAATSNAARHDAAPADCKLYFVYSPLASAVVVDQACHPDGGKRH